VADIDRVIFASYGNDSVATVQWCLEYGIKNAYVAYSDTGWAMRQWHARVKMGEDWVRSIGYEPVRIDSMGMLGLIEKKKAWPRGGGGKYQFCTEMLKEAPALVWLDQVDPNGDLICTIGVRREESANRATHPEWIEESPKHGGRTLHAPLVRHTEAQRDELISRTPFLVPLPHRSKECYPCVNARKGEIAALPENRRQLIRLYERHLGTNSMGNPRVMFSPKRHKGATGIDEVYHWSGGDGRDDAPLPACDGGWCGA
jgi:3'-phosphoadenosine 5'-phosphosulfate sulfotransferase (PAPS reductase)/FAD synthetase